MPPGSSPQHASAAGKISNLPHCHIVPRRTWCRLSRRRGAEPALWAVTRQVGTEAVLMIMRCGRVAKRDLACGLALGLDGSGNLLTTASSIPGFSAHRWSSRRRHQSCRRTGTPNLPGPHRRRTYHRCG
eukprot:7385127-Prymnesium_polylepis.1